MQYMKTMMQRSRRRFGLAILTAALSATCLVGIAPAFAGTVEVAVSLPVKARLDLTELETIIVAPFLVVSSEGDAPIRQRGIDVQAEFERYLNRLLRRQTRLRVLDPGPIDYPSYDLDQLTNERDFWAAIGERTQADLILTGSLDFDIQDRSGYRTEEYISPYDGRTYYRQVLVEQTGFEYDIVMNVISGDDGSVLFEDNFKDFKGFEGENTDPLVGMFENLYALEDRIAGIFTQKLVQSTRILFTN